MQHDVTQTLSQRLPFWFDLAPEERRLLVEHARFVSFKAGERVRSANERAGVMLVLRGCLRAYMLSREGRQITLFRIGRQQSCVLAASCALSMITFDIFLDAMEDTELVLIDSACFARLVESNIFVEAFTYRQTAERFSEVMWVMEQVLFMSFDVRLAVFLLDEVSRAGTARLALTHDEIARHMGSAREVVSRMLKYFEREGLVTLGRGVVDIVDRRGLLTLATS